MNFILLSALFLLSAPPQSEQANLGEITRALGAGDIESLSAYMDSEVELSLLGEEDLYTKAAAVAKLDAFFRKHGPKAFSQVHQGASKSADAEYCIGNLSTASGSLRVYIYLAKKGSGSVLQELRIDRE